MWKTGVFLLKTDSKAGSPFETMPPGEDCRITVIHPGFASFNEAITPRFRNFGGPACVGTCEPSRYRLLRPRPAPSTFVGLGITLRR